MLNEIKKEYMLRITQANRSQLLVILFEMLSTYVEDAKTAQTIEDRLEMRESIRKARGCVDQLMITLDFEHSISSSLLQLYLYVNRELARADISNKLEPLDNINIVIDGLHDSFLQISKEDTSEPLMLNTQSIFAGLTYGKDNLNESLTNQSRNRGFLA